MSLTKQLQAVLDIEKEGAVRLEEARTQAGEILAEYRRKAEAIHRKKDEEMSALKKQRLRTFDEDVAGEVAAIEGDVSGERSRLLKLAEKSRRKALCMVISWLREGG